MSLGKRIGGGGDCTSLVVLPTLADLVGMVSR